MPTKHSASTFISNVPQSYGLVFRRRQNAGSVRAELRRGEFEHVEMIGFRCRDGVPQPNGVVPRCREDQRAVWTERCGEQFFVTAAQQHPKLAPGAGIPQTRGVVMRRAQDTPVIGTEYSMNHRILMPAKNRDLASGSGIPNARSLVVGPGDDLGAARVKSCRIHLAFMPLEVQNLPPRGDVPQPNGSVLLIIGYRENPRAIGAEYRRPHRSRMAAQHGKSSSRRGIPQPHRDVRRCRKHS